MDLRNLKWMKNVRDPDRRERIWAYVPSRNAQRSMELPEAKIFALGWKNDLRENAQEPEEEDLILLHQHARVTHIVKVLDNQLYENQENCGEYSIYRVVKAVWTPPRHMENWDDLPHQDEIFGYRVNIQGGDVHNLTIPHKMRRFHERWGYESLENFQNWVNERLEEIT